MPASELVARERQGDAADVHFAALLFLGHGGTVPELLHLVADAIACHDAMPSGDWDSPTERTPQ